MQGVRAKWMFLQQSPCPTDSNLNINIFATQLSLLYHLALDG